MSAPTSNVCGRAVREERPDDPLWHGVESIETDAAGVTVTFRPGADPRLQPVGRAAVACHLYDSR